ncbi:MAG: DUF934 domain-containing protein [Moraxella sp.]|nr:DUF934 domain-containing protein [Moraxella sp.]
MHLVQFDDKCHLAVINAYLTDDKLKIGDKEQNILPLISLSTPQDAHALITADTTIDELNQYFPKYNDHINLLVIYVEDFKDGRTFSLIRCLRNLNYQKDIIIAGNYGLDQAGYYHKSGATGFLVQDKQLDTLLTTLNDLKSGHLGKSVNGLPMFQ